MVFLIATQAWGLGHLPCRYMAGSRHARLHAGSKRRSYKRLTVGYKEKAAQCSGGLGLSSCAKQGFCGRRVCAGALVCTEPRRTAPAHLTIITIFDMLATARRQARKLCRYRQMTRCMFHCRHTDQPNCRSGQVIEAVRHLAALCSP